MWIQFNQNRTMTYFDNLKWEIFIAIKAIPQNKTTNNSILQTKLLLLNNQHLHRWSLNKIFKIHFIFFVKAPKHPCIKSAKQHNATNQPRCTNTHIHLICKFCLAKYFIYPCTPNYKDPSFLLNMLYLSYNLVDLLLPHKSKPHELASFVHIMLPIHHFQKNTWPSPTTPWRYTT